VIRRSLSLALLLVCAIAAPVAARNIAIDDMFA